MSEVRKEAFVIRTRGIPADGYTLAGVVKVEGRPTFKFSYRPALPEAVYGYRLAARNAETGDEHWKAVLDLLSAHVIDWDIVTVSDNEHTVPLKFGRDVLENPAVRAALGTEALDTMVNFVTGYAGWEEDRKKS